MSKNMAEKCPFREGSASEKVYMTLARADKSLSMAEIATRSKVPFKKTETLIRAYMNPYHNATMRRQAVAIAHDKDGYKLVTCKAEPNAKRPERGEAKDKKAAKAKKSAAPKKAKAKAGTKPKPSKPKAEKMPSPTAGPEPVPAQETTTIDSGAQPAQ